MLVGALVGTVVTTAAVGVFTLFAVDRAEHAMDVAARTRVQLLHSLTTHVAEFRIAELQQALAADKAEREKARAEAEQLGAQIDRLSRQFKDQFPEAGIETVETEFRQAWRVWRDAHATWSLQGANSDAASDDLFKLYKATEAAIDEIAARVEHDPADRFPDSMELWRQASAVMILLSAGSIVLGLLTLAALRSGVIRPLEAMTRALTRLAAGDRDVAVPELHRTDEIGQMAKAFDVFRANAMELERAHLATQTAQAQAETLARQDALTGLPNRRMFSARLQSAVNRIDEGLGAYCIFIIDLDRFKPVNDIQGHPIGDLVLCEVARRLSAAMRNSDTVARLGGDEFAVIAEVSRHSHVEEATIIAEKLLAAVRQPISAGDSVIELDASIGIAFGAVAGAQPDGLLRAADIAMYRAKRDGKGAFRFFEKEMDEELRARAALETALKRAVSEGEIRPHYQPLVEMQDGAIYGFEILARWAQSGNESIPPDVFIPLAEQMGLIPDLTWSILRQACRDAASWPDRVSLSLNISPAQLKDPMLPLHLLAILSEEAFPPSRLEIEITETALVACVETAKPILAALRACGVKISLDDFGTGYSSLAHLREFQLDKVKIDRSFVQAMRFNGECEKIVDAILSLSRSLGMTTVAEGIESIDVARKLNERFCEFGQGYHFGKPMPNDKVLDLLNARHAATDHSPKFSAA